LATLFFSYSRADLALRDELEKNLAVLKNHSGIETWHDREIRAGEEFGTVIDERLDTADIILLLASPDFLASDYCYKREMPHAMDRHRSGQAIVIPVILRPCDWRYTPFASLHATPLDGRPITQWPDRDEALQQVVGAVREALQRLGRSRKHKDWRQARLRELLERPPPGKTWRKIETLCGAIDREEAETTRLLLDIGARRSTGRNNVWKI
jgi:hypothetical protein